MSLMAHHDLWKVVSMPSLFLTVPCRGELDTGALENYPIPRKDRFTEFPLHP